MKSEVVYTVESYQDLRELLQKAGQNRQQPLIEGALDLYVEPYSSSDNRIRLRGGDAARVKLADNGTSWMMTRFTQWLVLEQLGIPTTPLSKPGKQRDEDDDEEEEEEGDE